MFALIKKAGLILGALVLAIGIYLVAASPHAEEFAESEAASPGPFHFSHHGGGSAGAAHIPGDQALVVSMSEVGPEVQLSMSIAGQSSPVTMADLLTVLEKYADEGASVDLFLKVDPEVPFSGVQEFIENSMKVPNVHLRLLEKYVLLHAKEGGAR